MLTYLSHLVAREQGDQEYVRITPAQRVWIDGTLCLYLQACRADEMGVQYMDQSAQWRRLHEDQHEIITAVALYLSSYDAPKEPAKNQHHAAL